MGHSQSKKGPRKEQRRTEDDIIEPIPVRRTGAYEELMGVGRTENDREPERENVDNTFQQFWHTYTNSEQMSFEERVKFAEDVSIAFEDVELTPEIRENIVLYSASLFGFFAKDEYSYVRYERLEANFLKQALRRKDISSGDILHQIRAGIKALHFQIQDEPKLFAQFYAFLFPFFSSGSLDRDLAAMLWNVCFSIQKFPLKKVWLSYVKNTLTKNVSHDVWQMFPEFVAYIEVCGLHGYDDTDAWPTVFDDFVGYASLNSVFDSLMHMCLRRVAELISNETMPESQLNLVPEELRVGVKQLLMLRKRFMFL